MKKIIAFLLAAALLLSFAGCGKEDPSPTPDPQPEINRVCNTKWDGKSLKVLCVGNSFALNATKVLYQIAQAHGVEEITLGVLHIPGCTIATHLEKAKSAEAAYKYYKNTTGTWEITENTTWSLVGELSNS